MVSTSKKDDLNSIFSSDWAADHYVPFLGTLSSWMYDIDSAWRTKLFLVYMTALGSGPQSPISLLMPSVRMRTKIRKKFPGSGWFVGVIVEIFVEMEPNQSSTALILYEDGDTETMNEEDTRAGIDRYHSYISKESVSPYPAENTKKGSSTVAS